MAALQGTHFKFATREGVMLIEHRCRTLRPILFRAPVRHPEGSGRRPTILSMGPKLFTSRAKRAPAEPTDARKYRLIKHRQMAFGSKGTRRRTSSRVP